MLIILKPNTIPDKDYAIYPDLGIKVAESGCVYLNSSFLIKIIRNDTEYLVPFYKSNYFLTTYEFYERLNNFIKEINIEIEKIKEFYIVDEELFRNSDLTLYKYAKI